MPTPLTPEELWKKLTEEAGEDAIASAAGVSVRQAEQDLRAADFDVKAERNRAHALIADLTGDSSPASDRGEPTAWVSGPPSSVRKTSANRRPVLIAVAIAALATGAGILYALGRRSTPHDIPVDVPSATTAPPPPNDKPPEDKPVPAAPAGQDKPAR
jgi:hypothetical protein